MALKRFIAIFFIAFASAGFWHGNGSLVSLGNFATAPNVANVYALRKIYPPYNGPAIRLQRASDGAQLDFNFNAHGDLPRQAIQDWAQSRSIAIATIYDQSPVGNNITTVSMAAAPVLTLINAAGYPEVTVAATQYMIGTSASNGKGLLSLVARATGGGALISQALPSNIFQLDSAFQFSVSPNGGGGSVSIGSFSGTIGGTYSNLYGTNNQKGFNAGSVVATGSPGQFTFAPSGSELDINHFQFGGQDYVGSWQEIVITYDELSPTVMANFSASDGTYYSTPLPDTLGPVNPTIANAAATSAVVGHGSSSFGSVVVTDTNTGSPTDSVTITLAGSAGGTLTGTGLSGTGPYTLAAASPATITTELQSIVYAPAGAAGTSETLTIAIVSSAGSSASNSNSVVSVIAVAGAETAFSAPVGTFTPVSHKGVNIIGAESAYPDASGFNYIYPANEEIDYFAGKGFGMIRMSLTARRMQPASYGALDPANRTDEAPTQYCQLVGTPSGSPPCYAAGSQTNLLEIKRVLDRAFSKNMYVMMEPHDSGTIFDTLTKKVRNIGADAEATAQFADWWTRMATKFKNYPNAVFNLINEPQVQTAAQNKTGMVAAINGIASVTTTQLVAVPGVFFTSAFHWANGDSGNDVAWAGYTPPAGMSIAFDMHNYLDSDQSGQHIPCVVGVGSSSLTLATAWARTNGFKIILGETGWSTDSTCPPEATTFMAYMTSNSDVWLGWTYFNGGSVVFYGSYAYGVVPTGYPTGPFTDKPQMSILVANE